MKKITFCINAIILCTLLFALSFVHAATVDIPDTYDLAVTNAFDVADGTTVSTNGIFIVFEGELTFDTNITASADGSGRVLASTQVYVKMKLFDDLPSVDNFTNKQAAVLGLFDTGDTTNGTLYAISGAGAGVGWLQLTNDNNNTIAVSESDTNLVTIILRSPGTGFTYYEYTVSLSELDDSTNSTTQITSQNLISPLETNGISRIGVVGKGALVSTASAAGDPGPLSTSIDFAVYQTTNGLFLVDLYTVDENGNGSLDVYVKIDGVWVFLEAVDAKGEGSNHYQLTVSGLTVGESYLFKVVDEEGYTHFSNGEIEVKSIKMEAVRLNLDNFFVINFNSEDGMYYQLLLSTDISASVAEWNATDVEVYLGGDVWSDSMNEFQGTGDITQIRVPRSGTNIKAFFKIKLVD